MDRLHCVPEFSDNISVNSDDTDFLLSANINRLPQDLESVQESFVSTLEPSKYEQFVMTDGYLHSPRVTPPMKTFNDHSPLQPLMEDKYNFTRNYLNSLSDTSGTEITDGTNLSFVQRLKTDYGYSLDSSLKRGEDRGGNKVTFNEPSKNVLVNSMNDEEKEEFGK